MPELNTRNGIPWEVYKLNTYLVLYFSHLRDVKKNFIKIFQ
jgi:hypothetical protein